AVRACFGVVLRQLERVAEVLVGGAQVLVELGAQPLGVDAREAVVDLEETVVVQAAYEVDQAKDVVALGVARIEAERLARLLLGGLQITAAEEVLGEEHPVLALFRLDLGSPAGRQGPEPE